MPQPVGRNLPLSLPRRVICELMHFSQKVPSIPVERHMNIRAVVAARRLAVPRPSWVAVFTKAYARIAADRPELRRAYLSFPRPHLYEHPINVASIAFERRFGDEDAVFFAHMSRPENRTLGDIDAVLARFKEAPLENIGSFRQALRMARLPQPLRRMAWWVGLNTWGRKRAHYMGTFGVSVYSSFGAASLHPLSVLTTTLNYGVISEAGDVDVRLVYDHRVLDGAPVARALGEMEEVLNGEILAELRYLEGVEPPSVESFSRELRASAGPTSPRSLEAHG